MIMRKNRLFTINDLKDYALSKGYELDFHRYKRVFTLIKIDSPNEWSWIYYPHTEDKLVERVDNLNFDGWKVAIDKTISSITEQDKINY